MPEILVLPDADAVAVALADRTAEALRATLARAPRATLCLTGGSTPEPAYRRLARAEGIDWPRVHVFWGDERSVPPEHPDSNYGMARRALLDAVGIPDENVHRMPGECPSDKGALIYEQALEQFFGNEMAFDVLHLGMGADGHTASLFPDSAALREMDRRVVPAEAPPDSPVRNRLTLTFPALNRARLCLVAAAGAAKRDAFQAVLDAFDDDADLGPPAARVVPAGELVWLVDRAVAQGTGADDEAEG